MLRDRDGAASSMLADMMDTDQLLPRSKALSHRQRGPAAPSPCGVRVALMPRLSTTAGVGAAG